MRERQHDNEQKQTKRNPSSNPMKSKDPKLRNKNNNQRIKNLQINNEYTIRNVSTASKKQKRTQIQQYTQAKTPLPRSNSSIAQTHLLSINQQKQLTPNYEDIYQMDSTPLWAIKGTDDCRDKNQHNYKHVEYDPTTLYIPERAKKDMTCVQRQYWDTKSNYFDKIVLFKNGHHYETYYQDADISERYLNLKKGINGTKKACVSFHKNNYHQYINQFVQLGFKVVVVQQKETQEEMKERRNEEKKNNPFGKRSNKIVNRGIEQILTKGTYFNPPIMTQDIQKLNILQNKYHPKYLISVQYNYPEYAFSLLNASNNIILIGKSRNRQEFITMLHITRPVQLLYDPNNLPLNDVKMMTQSFFAMVKSPLPDSSKWFYQTIRTLLKDFPSCFLPERELSQQLGKIKRMIQSSLSGMFEYIKQLFIDKIVLQTIKIQMYELKQNNNMILDSPVIRHLQILETSTGEEEGSLLSVINQCRTAFGKRLMKKWLCRPSTNTKVINQRLNAVVDLNAYLPNKIQFNAILGRIPDLQIIIQKLRRNNVKLQSNRVISLSSINKRMLQYYKFLSYIQCSYDQLKMLKERIKYFKSKRLKNLLFETEEDNIKNIFIEEEDDDETGQAPLLPIIINHYNQISLLLTMQYIQKTNQRQMLPQLQFILQTPIYKKCHKIKEQIENSRKQLQQKYLQQQKEIIEINMRQRQQKYPQLPRIYFDQSKVCFVHIKEDYEIEIPQELQVIKPKQFIYSSKRVGFKRYVTNKSRELVQQFRKNKEHLLQQISKRFCQKRWVWEKYIRVLAEIDCLISNSIVSQEFECRPTFNTQGQLNIVQGKHPCLSHLRLISNDIHLKQEQSMMLLMGANMSGKSTFMRMVCVLAIIAQMGIFVPCKSYNSIVFDRVFSRVGASDRLIENKSTFFIELEETKLIADFATSKSLVIVEELGRGTQINDGMCIAEATFKYLLQKTKCMGLFATHYDSVVENFLFNKNVQIYYMDYTLKEDIKQIKFKYKLEKGKCDESFALNVARMVNIDQRIIDKATILKQKMRAEIKLKRLNQVTAQYNRLEKEFQF